MFKGTRQEIQVDRVDSLVEELRAQFREYSNCWPPKKIRSVSRLMHEMSGRGLRKRGLMFVFSAANETNKLEIDMEAARVRQITEVYKLETHTGRILPLEGSASQMPI